MRDAGQGVRPAGRPLSGRKSFGFPLEAAMSPEMYFFPVDILVPSSVEESYMEE